MLSGALLLNRDFSLKDFFKKRFSRIVYPYIFWISITVILGYFFFGFSDNIPLIILGEQKYTWFVWTLAGLYLFIPVINSFIKEFSLDGIKYFLIIWIVTIILNTFRHYPFHALELSYFAGYLGYLLLGYYLVKVPIKNTKKIMILSLIFSFCHF